MTAREHWHPCSRATLVTSASQVLTQAVFTGVQKWHEPWTRAVNTSSVYRPLTVTGGFSNTATRPSLEVALIGSATFLADRGSGGGALNLQNFRLAVTCLQFRIKVCFSATISHPSSCWELLFSSCDCELWPMTLTFELDLYNVTLKSRARNLHPCLKKRPTLACCCYNFDKRKWILIFFGRNVIDKVVNQKVF